MIELTMQGKAGKKFYLNPHHIEIIECVPDTTITLLSGKTIIVAEPYAAIFDKIVEYRRLIVGFRNEE